MKPLPLAALLATALLAGCPPPVSPPGPEDGAAYLGLAVGKTITYAIGDSLTETHEVRESSVLVDDKLAFDLLARQNGFLVDERTLTIAVGPDDAQLVRFFDCVTRCAQPSAPIPFVSIPLDGGQQSEATVDVTLSENGVEQGSQSESHVVVVAAEAPVTVPAGTFEAFTLSWTRTVGDESETSVIKIAPETGIVSWDSFDGSQLRRAE